MIAAAGFLLRVMWVGIYATVSRSATRTAS